MHEENDLEEAPRGYSFPVLPMWVVYFLLLVVIAQVSTIWGRAVLHGVYLLIVLLSAQTAFSKKALEKARQVDATMTSGTWQWNMLLFFVVIPLLVWVGGMTMRGWRF